MERRTFLARGGQTVVCALAGRVTKYGLPKEQGQSKDLSNTLEQRDGVPLFDAGFTDDQGVRGKLGLLGSDSAIALLEIGPLHLADPRSEHQGPISGARHSQHKGVVLLTRGRRPGHLGRIQLPL